MRTLAIDNVGMIKLKSSLIAGIFLILLFDSCAQNGHNDLKNIKFGIFQFYQNDTIKTRLKEIVRTDSINNLESGYLIYKSFDLNDTIVRELKYFQGQSNTTHGYLTQNIYDKKGRLILYELFNMEGLEIERYKFEYNDNGQVTKKEGFGSGEIGITIKYFYSSTGELIDKKAFRFGKEEKEYFKTMK